MDSINLDKILNEAIKRAGQKKDLDRFREAYVTSIKDSSYPVEVDISSDFYFTNEHPTLLIRRNTPSTIYIDFFSKAGNEFLRVLSHEQWKLEYLGDTIRDINGDNLKDFVVNWYGSTGCCLKAFSNIYLLRSDKKSFSKDFRFINPTFSPKEKIIRGVCYGHPGETQMYKYKWVDETVDTLEYVEFEKNEAGKKTGKIIVSKDRFYKKGNEVWKRLSSVPDEYRKIEGYDWFTGEVYD